MCCATGGSRGIEAKAMRTIDGAEIRAAALRGGSSRARAPAGGALAGRGAPLRHKLIVSPPHAGSDRCI